MIGGLGVRTICRRTITNVWARCRHERVQAITGARRARDQRDGAPLSLLLDLFDPIDRVAAACDDGFTYAGCADCHDAGDQADNGFGRGKCSRLGEYRQLPTVFDVRRLVTGLRRKGTWATVGLRVGAELLPQQVFEGVAVFDAHS
jgi:hypothetical protein